MTSLRDAATFEQTDDTSAEPPLPAEAPLPAEVPPPPAMLPAINQHTAAAQLLPLAPAAELPSPNFFQAHRAATQPAAPAPLAPAQPMTPAEPVGPAQPVAPASATELPSPHPLHAHPADQAPAPLAAPVQLQIPAHSHTSNAPVDPGSVQPARVQPSAFRFPKVAQPAGNVASAVDQQAAQPHTGPQANDCRHANSTPEVTRSDDSVASAGCLNILCCFKTRKLHQKTGTGKRGIFGRSRR